MRELARYWGTEYDWRRCEAKPNALPQFTTEIDGVDVQFIHVRPRHETALPLIMTHGWPGLVIELLDTVGPLTDPTSRGGTPRRVPPGAAVVARLRLLGRAGRARLGVRSHRTRVGGPPRLPAPRRPGATWVHAMGRRAPEGLLGVHLNLLAAALGLEDQLPALTEPERAAHYAVNTSWSSPPGRRRSLLAAGFTGRAGVLVARSRHGQLLQDLSRVRRRGAGGQPPPGQPRRQHHAVLADGHRRLGRPVVLGVRTGPGRGPCGRPGSSGGLGPGRLHDLPRPIRPPKIALVTPMPNSRRLAHRCRFGVTTATRAVERFELPARWYPNLDAGVLTGALRRGHGYQATEIGRA